MTNCHRLKLPAADGKSYLTDVATAETLLRLVQSVPSPKAEPIKLWLAKVGYERMKEMSDPGLSLDRARETLQKHGRSEKWIQQRMTGQELERDPTVKESLTVHQEGNRAMRRRVELYNLDVIISVGYRVKSAVATRFRIWATQQLREYIVKGFVLDDERLKNPGRPGAW